MSEFNPIPPNFTCKYQQAAYTSMVEDAKAAGCWNAPSYPTLKAYAQALAAYLEMIECKEDLVLTIGEARYGLRMIRLNSDIAKHWQAAIKLSKLCARLSTPSNPEFQVASTGAQLKLVSKDRNIPT